MGKAALNIVTDRWPSEDYSRIRKDCVNILFIDHSLENHADYQSMLEGMGQNIMFARSGEEALKMVSEHEFAVILLNAAVPGMNGFEMASQIHQRKKSAHTPIIFITPYTDDLRMVQGYASGAVDYLPIPIVPEILRAKVRVFIELSQMRRKAALQAEERMRRKAAEEAAHRSAFLVTASEILSRSRDPKEVLYELARIPVPHLGDVSVVRIYGADSKIEHSEWSWTGADGTVHTESSIMTVFPELDQAMQHVLATGQYQLLDNIPAISLYPEMSNVGIFKNYVTAVSFLLSSVLVLPLTVRGKTQGVLVVGRQQPDMPYSSNDVSLSHHLTSMAAISLENTILLQQIKEADHRKDEFLATLAHELRNPLAPISNALQVMKMTDRPEMRKQAEDTIERQLNHMVHLVDDLMDVSRITQGKIELRKEKIELGSILQCAIETVQPLIKQRGHSFSLELPKETIWLEADSARISQIFSNLLSNSVKYTNNGGTIVMSAEPVGQMVEIAIKDNGIGIPPDMLPEIFKMFLQVDASLERSQGGLGIGLTLVKSFVEMHGGTVEARSEGQGKGSEFIVRLPITENLSVTANQNISVGGMEGLSSLRVLVVDDNEASAKTMGWMMEFYGHEIKIAHDGPSAIKTALEYRPSIILLDIGLPGMNGYEVCKAMRLEPSLKNAILIAQTGWGQPEHRQRSKEAGFNHHLTKPVDIKTLEKLLKDISPSASLPA